MLLNILQSISKKLILIIVIIWIGLLIVGSVLEDHRIEGDFIDGFWLLNKCSSSGCPFSAVGLCVALFPAVPALHVSLCGSTWSTLSLSLVV